MFPFQLVPLADFAYMTLRRSCPSAAAGRGRTLESHRRELRKLVARGRLAPKPARPPAIATGRPRSWKDTLRVTDVIERLMLDQRYPVVRRLVHGIRFCDLLAGCRLGKFQSGELAELLGILEGSVEDGVSDLFRDRPSPGKTARLFFRRAALEYLRLHPRFSVEESWRSRWRLTRAAAAMARGKGVLPRIHPDLPSTTLEALERPLGHMRAEVLRPITAYFEASAASVQYAILGRRGWPLVQGFHALALSYPIALWMLRLVATGRTPEVEDAIGVVAAIDRGHGFAPLSGRRHRRGLATLARLGELPRLVAWYAR
jgi:hypothetical protein